MKWNCRTGDKNQRCGSFTILRQFFGFLQSGAGACLQIYFRHLPKQNVFLHLRDVWAEFRLCRLPVALMQSEFPANCVAYPAENNCQTHLRTYVLVKKFGRTVCIVRIYVSKSGKEIMIDSCFGTVDWRPHFRSV